MGADQAAVTAAEEKERQRSRDRRYLRGVVLLAAAATILSLLSYVPSQIDADRFASAPACAATQTTGCIAHGTATVLNRTQKVVGKSTDYTIELQGPGSGTNSVELGKGVDVWSHLQQGQSVTVDVWRGKIVAVDADSGSIKLKDWPDFRTLVPLLFFNVMFGVCLGGLVYMNGHRFRFLARPRWAAGFIALWLPMSGLAYGVVAVVHGGSQPLLYGPVLLAVAVGGLVVRPFIVFMVRLRFGRDVKFWGA